MTGTEASILCCLSICFLVMQVSSDLTTEEVYQPPFATSCCVTTSPKDSQNRGVFISEGTRELASYAVSAPQDLLVLLLSLQSAWRLAGPGLIPVRGRWLADFPVVTGPYVPYHTHGDGGSPERLEGTRLGQDPRGGAFHSPSGEGKAKKSHDQRLGSREE